MEGKNIIIAVDITDNCTARSTLISITVVVKKIILTAEDTASGLTQLSQAMARCNRAVRLNNYAINIGTAGRFSC
ncbi:MAG: hypothetical protein RMY29_017465 [Nostoc sp. CreGUA01]